MVLVLVLVLVLPRAPPKMSRIARHTPTEVAASSCALSPTLLFAAAAAAAAACAHARVDHACADLSAALSLFGMVTSASLGVSTAAMASISLSHASG